MYGVSKMIQTKDGEHSMIDEQIAATARAINRQIEDLADARARVTRNIMILEDGRVYEIENHLFLEQVVKDKENVLSDMLMRLDSLIKERDGI